MKKLIAYFIRYPIWTNVLMFSLLSFGVISFFSMKFSAFPETEPSLLFVRVPFIGASPEEVEEGVIIKIEEALEGLEGIERITSEARENIGTVNVEILDGADINTVLADVKNAVDRISSFPVGIEKPVISAQPRISQAVQVVVFGETDLYNLKYISESIRDELLASDEISQVTVVGVPSLEISIEVAEADLRRYELTFDEIAAKVRSANVNISGGKFDTNDEEILIRAYGRDYYANELRDLVVRGSEAGTVLYLKDVAEIEERWQDVPDKSYYNDKPAVILDVDKTLEESVLDVVAKTQEIVDAFNAQHTQVRAVLIDDQSQGIGQRLNLLITNGLIGTMLVVITIGFFMNIRLSFWVSIGIPISFAGMFLVALLSGLTINVISTFGMVIVIGILVDDAIVVGENIFAHYERGKPPLQSAIDGTIEMLAPVFTSVTTTIIAFTPFFFIEGFLGKFIWQMALVVIASLFFSLVEAFFILPAHLAHSKGLHPHAQDPRIRRKIEAAIQFLTQKLYAPTLRAAMRHKWITVVTPIALFMLTIGFFSGGFIGFTFFPFIDRDTLSINLSLVSGRQEADTEAVLSKIEKAAWELNEQLRDERADGKNVILGINKDLGSNDFGEAGSHTGKLVLQLLEGEIRQMDTYIIGNRLRDMVGPIPQAQSITYANATFFGKPISLSLLGNDLDELNKASELLLEELEAFESLKDVTVSNAAGRREIDIKLKPRAESLGLSLREVAGQVRQGFFGEEIQRIQRGRDEIRVWVRYRPEDRAAIGNLEQMRIRTPDGAEYPFSELASYEIERGVTKINRLERKREVKIEANQSDVTDDLPPILAEIEQVLQTKVLPQVQGVEVSFEGQSRGQEKSNRSLGRGFGIAMILMFILVVLVFRSYLQAVLVFSLIPLAVLGALWGHGIQGVAVNTLSMYGIIALSGIIINDSIVLIDQINRNLRSGLKVFEAVFDAALARLRPILLTSLTTSFGLAPLILENSRQAQFLIPMAISVAYGLLFGTLILLYLLPAAYLALNRLRVLTFELVSSKTSPELVEPAVKELQAGKIGGYLSGAQ